VGAALSEAAESIAKHAVLIYVLVVPHERFSVLSQPILAPSNLDGLNQRLLQSEGEIDACFAGFTE
jgi:hypothetical protein